MHLTLVLLVLLVLLPPLLLLLLLVMVVMNVKGMQGDGRFRAALAVVAEAAAKAEVGAIAGTAAPMKLLPGRRVMTRVLVVLMEATAIPAPPRTPWRHLSAAGGLPMACTSSAPCVHGWRWIP